LTDGRAPVQRRFTPARDTVVAVASHSFPKHPTLRCELLDSFPGARFNETGSPLAGAPLVDFLRGAAAAITGLEVLDESVFSAVPELRFVSKYGVGLDTIDLDAARRHGVEVRWTPGVNRQAVAELTIGFMIALCRRMVPLAIDVRDGGWRQAGGRQLSSAVVGIIGCGQVGKEVARLCRAFGARVIAHDIVSYQEFYRQNGVTPVSLAGLLAEADIVTLHTPLDRSTRGLVGEREIAAMKPTSFLVNAARGGLVDETALRSALVAGRIAGAALDVFEREPPDPAWFADVPNLLATPHIGASTEDARLAMGRAAIAGLLRSRESLDLTRKMAESKA
jgi:phosphoglycerate dehydrogenase-like enzyme